MKVEGQPTQTEQSAPSLVAVSAVLRLNAHIAPDTALVRGTG